MQVPCSITSREVYYDEQTSRWCVAFHDEAGTVCSHPDKTVLEEFLDYLDARTETAP